MTQQYYEDYLRPYLEIKFMDEPFPMFIKLVNDRTSASAEQFMSMAISIDGDLMLEFNTGYLCPVTTIDGLSARVLEHTRFGDKRVLLTISKERPCMARIKHLPEGCRYIDASRQHYAMKYGVKYSNE
jgi:hypothetical protein